MGLLLTGAILLLAVLGLFYLKDELRIAWLARLAYCELVMRIAVLAVVFMILGTLLLAGRWFDALF